MTTDVKIYANTIDIEESRVAVVEDGRLRELFVEHAWEVQRGGEIYKARVESVVPGMDAAFLDLGDGRNGFLYLADARGLEVKRDRPLIVQVVKAARKNKGPRVSPQISLPGRFCVYLPGGSDVGVSHKIASGEERRRLHELVSSFDLAGGGVIVRTAAQNARDDELEADLTELVAQWREVQKLAEACSAPCLLWRDLGLLGRVLREEMSSPVSEIWVDNREEYDRTRAWLECGGGDRLETLSLHRADTPLFEYYDLEKSIEAMARSKVWLPSGGYLVIDQTEALTVVDVNTGKYVGGSTLSDTVTVTNLEAAREIAWQLRLRSIGGIVVVDFIDMVRESDRLQLLEALREALGADHCKTRVFGISALGLVEMTRKRTRSDFRGQMTRPCAACDGGGRIWKEDVMAAAIKRRLRKTFACSSATAALVALNATLARYVANEWLSSWERELGRRVVLRALPDLPWDQWRIEVTGDVQRVEAQAACPWAREESARVYRTTDA